VKKRAIELKKLYIAAPSDTFKFEYQKCYVNLHLTITCFDDKQSVVTNGNILWLTVKLDSSNGELQVLKTAKKFETQIINYTFLSMVSYIVPKLTSMRKTRKVGDKEEP